MRESDLRRVLLVKAMEEEADAALLPAADRIAAAREAKGEAPPRHPLRLEEGTLPAPAERLLALRARRLLAQVAVRHPFIEEIAGFEPSAWLSVAICVVAFAVGLALSALDGSHRINVLAFPLWGVVLWNLLVYAVVVFSWARSKRRARRRVPEWIANAVLARVGAVVVRARHFHAPLAQALARFAADWQQAVRPILASRASAIFHGAAALLGVGLIAGFYIRGVALDYRAGWESTFLDAHAARSVLRVLYGPASALTGIAIPDTPHLEAIRWRGDAGGEPAAPWIHLLAATTLLLVVVPRLLLTLVSTISASHAARSMRLPAAMAAYFDRAFREAGVAIEGGGVRVIPYAYEPASGSIERLRALHADASLDVRAPVAYGAEESIAPLVRDGEPPAAIALLFTSAGTPEEEGHGRAIDAARDAAVSRSMRVEAIVDEGPYIARMGAELASRVEERRRAWARIAEAHGIEARFVDLSK